MPQNQYIDYNLGPAAETHILSCSFYPIVTFCNKIITTSDQILLEEQTGEPWSLAEHTKRKPENDTADRHTGKRAGGPEKKKSEKKGWKTNK